MKHFMLAAAVFAVGAAAQQDQVMRKLMMSAPGVIGTVVRGAPYSADEVTESLQVLSDGTRISHKEQVSVYRDADGRVRRESPTQITILDPVAGVSYVLNPKTMTGVKSWIHTLRPDGAIGIPREKTLARVPDSADTAKAKADTEAKLDKLKAELAARNGSMVINGNPASDQTAYAMKMELDEAAAKLVANGPPVIEMLGQQVIEGLTADGTRTTETVAAGAVGNDRPIQVVRERWYSADLQTAVMTKRADPRTGENTFRLTNVRRGDPPAYFFSPPAGYQIDTLASPAKKEE